MTLEVPVGYHNITFIYQAVGSVRQQTFQLGFQDLSAPLPPPSTTVSQVRLDWTAATAPGAAVRTSNKYTFLGCVDHYQDETGVVIYEDRVVLPGTAIYSPTPINGALLVRKDTGIGGRRNRGRMYVPPFGYGEELVDAVGVIDSAAVVNLQTPWTAWYTTLRADDLQPVLFHSEAPFTATPIAAFVVQARMATQRRRMRR